MTDKLHDRVVAAIGDQYEIEHEIGRGGMSVVYRARDGRLKRAVALKVLPPELAYDPAIRTRFTREAQTSAQLSHPHIVPIYDVGDRDGIAYFVMAMVPGGNLGAVLAREPRQPVDEVRRLLREIADALAYAHQRGVVHRDIKPDNILLDANRRAVVTDFGIARAMEGGTRLTVTGAAVGTPAYMSPEQAMGDRELDGRSDIYSLGVLAYQMLTGRVPFTGGNSMALLLKHVTEQPRPIHDLRPDTPPALAEVVERALMKDPEERWPTAEALRDALMADELPSVARRTEGLPHRAAASRLHHGASSAAVVEHGRTSPRSDVPAPAHMQPPQGTARRTGGPFGRGELIIEPEHLTALTPEQRKDLRLWHGRIHLMDRVKAMRGYAAATLVMWFAGFGGIAGAIEGDFPPAVLAPLVPMYMTMKLWRRGRSLRQAGLRLRRVLLMPRARWVLPKAAPALTQQQLEKVASRQLLESPHGAAIRRAADDQLAILDVLAKMPKEDRALLPDIEPTVKGLVERVVHLAQLLHDLGHDVDARLLSELDRRIADAERDSDTAEGERRLALLRRQRTTLQEIEQRRGMLAHQLDSAGLALGNLRLDLIKLRSSGMQSALADVSTATQEARAISREIGAVLAAAAEIRRL